MNKGGISDTAMVFIVPQPVHIPLIPIHLDTLQTCKYTYNTSMYLYTHPQMSLYLNTVSERQFVQSYYGRRDKNSAKASYLSIAYSCRLPASLFYSFVDQTRSV